MNPCPWRWHSFAVLVVAAMASAGAWGANNWDEPRAAFRLHGNSYYVGTQGISAILVTSAQGHVLIDGGTAAGAAVIARNIELLGFRLRDVRLILNSHTHHDHAGGIAELQRRSGAQVKASRKAALTLANGRIRRDDPQYGAIPDFAAVKDVRTVEDGEVLHVGPIALTAHYTPGHTRGGTSWSWQSCEGARCLQLVYADSFTAVSADGFRFSASRNYPDVVSDFARSFAVIESLPCDILVTPHPEVSALWERLARRDAESTPDALVDTDACRRYAGNARRAFDARLQRERAP